MHSIRLFVFGCCLVMLAAVAAAAPLPCKDHGTERWPVKITVPDGAKSETMTLSNALKLARLTDVKKNDTRYQDKRISDQPVHEDALVTLSGWLYLVAFESDDCDFHIQISPKPLTTSTKPTAQDNSIIVEVPSGQYATTISDQVEGVRQWVIAKLLANKPPKIASVHVMVHPVYVRVTGALFYDDAHAYLPNGGTGRGKRGLQSKTLWELHPVTKLSFAPKPKAG